VTAAFAEARKTIAAWRSWLLGRGPLVVGRDR
jgi:hypothetical protein